MSPTAHWLEYVDWAEPVLQQPLRFDHGDALIPDVPGTGIEWNEEQVQRHLSLNSTAAPSIHPP